MADAGHEPGAIQRSDRRDADRRVADTAIGHADRRTGQRRSGLERRQERRARLD